MGSIFCNHAPTCRPSIAYRPNGWTSLVSSPERHCWTSQQWYPCEQGELGVRLFRFCRYSTMMLFHAGFLSVRSLDFIDIFVENDLANQHSGLRYRPSVGRAVQRSIGAEMLVSGVEKTLLVGVEGGSIKVNK